jgi:hypothetical protein
VNGAVVGWALAAAAVVVGWFSYGWRGLVLAVTVISFWLLLQFSRTVRLLRRAGAAPVGHVASAVMFNAQVRRGMRLADAIALTGSLGRKLPEDPETFAWRDGGDDEVTVVFDRGRCTRWELRRAEAPPPAA